MKPIAQCLPALAVLLIGTGLTQNLAVAHHSRAPFSLDTTIELEGEIERVRWANPHVFFELAVANSRAEETVWTLEGHSVSGMLSNEWTRDSIQTGDRVRAIVNPPVNPRSTHALIDFFYLDDGSAFGAFGPPPVSAVASDGEETSPPSDRRQQLAPSRDFSGNWGFERPLIDILLLPDPNFEELPLTRLGKEAVEQYDRSDNPSFSCEPPTLPALVTGPYGWRWIRESDRIVIEKEQAGRESTRTIYLDGRTTPNDFEPNHIGFSVGHFEENGEVLVVRTEGFSAQSWGLARGIPSSEQKRLIERYRLTNGGLKMTVEYEVSDPVYLTEPMRMHGVFDKELDREFVWVSCDPEAASEHLNNI